MGFSHGWLIAVSSVQKLCLNFENHLQHSCNKSSVSNFISKQLDVFQALMGTGTSTRALPCLVLVCQPESLEVTSKDKSFKFQFLTLKLWSSLKHSF